MSCKFTKQMTQIVPIKKMLANVLIIGMVINATCFSIETHAAFVDTCELSPNFRGKVAVSNVKSAQPGVWSTEVNFSTGKDVTVRNAKSFGNADKNSLKFQYYINGGAIAVGDYFHREILRVGPESSGAKTTSQGITQAQFDTLYTAMSSTLYKNLGTKSKGEYRVLHSVRTAKAAIDVAAKDGTMSEKDIKLCEVAALLHDIKKEEDNHGPIGAVYVKVNLSETLKSTLDIDDYDVDVICLAIRNHGGAVDTNSIIKNMVSDGKLGSNYTYERVLKIIEIVGACDYISKLYRQDSYSELFGEMEDEVSDATTLKACKSVLDEWVSLVQKDLTWNGIQLK
jgi:HD superfamily phosphodiesterase